MTLNGFKVLRDYVEERISEFDLIPVERKEALDRLGAQIQQLITSRQKVELIFICTHNSRRSHMGHLWAQLAASYFKIQDVFCYSGGTEATALNQMAVNVLKNAGMRINLVENSSNPIYRVYLPGQNEEIAAFSKEYTDPPNPTEGFIAVMTCFDADEACPIVHGARSRHAIPYEDPKRYDGTSEEKARYAERCAQISREMLYLFSRIPAGIMQVPCDFSIEDF